MDIEKLKTDIMLFSPWLSRLVMSVPIKPAESCPTAGTNGARIIYNPSWFGTLSPAHCMGTLVHEYLHILLGHHIRQLWRDLPRWNISADYELNPYVLAAGYSLPPEALIPPADWQNREAEWIYPRLPEDCADQWDYVTAPSNLSPEEHANAVQAWKELVASTPFSEAPGNLARALTTKLKPQRTIAEAIASYLSLTMDSSQETWAPPSRRYALFPSPEEIPSGHVIFVVDTSGSMSDDLIAQCLCEVMGVALVSRVDLIYADAVVQAIHEEINITCIPTPKGGGGTDFRPALAEITKRQPDISVYLTDGAGTYGPPQSGIVWASPIRPPWGQWIDITNLTRSK